MSSSSLLRGMKPHLVDPFGRVIDYVRLSITDRCDFRCTYCMGEEMTFLPREEILSLEECAQVAQAFIALGVNKIRLTGGEPLVRKNAIQLVRNIGAMPGLRELVMTTNGSQLARHAAELRAAGVRRINISLDTLDAETFKRMTRVGDLKKVLSGIDAAISAQFEAIKLNVVVMRGVNDSHIERLVDFAVAKGVDIAFIEEMPLGAVDHARGATFVSNDEIRERLTRRYALIPSTETTGGPARYWRVADHRTRIGFISPHSHNFCASCNRVRVTCKGELFPCLGQEQKTDLLPVLRTHPGDQQILMDAIVGAIARKPREHHFDLAKTEPAVVRFMSMTGG